MRGAALFVAVWALSCCAPMQVHRVNRTPDPAVQARLSHVRLVDPSAVELTLELTIANPGPAIDITRADYLVYASDRPLASVHTLLPRTLSADGPTSITLATSFKYLSLPRRARTDLVLEETLRIAVRGELVRATGDSITSPPLAFDAETADVSFDAKSGD